METNFKYFIKLQKAYQEGKDYFVQGIATGILEDRDEERMSESVIKMFADSIPMPLTDAHPERGPILGQIGEVMYASILDDENKSLFIKAKLDMDHPAVPYLIKQLEKGKKFAFSIEGTAPEVHEVWSDKLGQMITEYLKVIPKATSITTEPSYIGSFLEVVSKAYNKNLNLVNTQTMKKKTLQTETEQATVEVKPDQVEPEVETPIAVQEVEKATGDQAVAAADKVEPEDKKENPLNISDPTTLDKAGSEDIVAQIAAIEAQLASLKEQVSLGEEVEEPEEAEEVETEPEVKAEGEVPAEVIPEVKAEVPTEAPAMGVEDKIDALATGLQAVLTKLDELVNSDKEVHSEIGKSKEENLTMLKAFYDEITNLPLQKRSMVKAKSVDEIVNPKPISFRDVVSKMDLI